MLKLSQLYLRRTLLLFVSAFLIAAAVGYLLLRQMEIHTHETMLRNMIVLLEGELQSVDPKRIPSILRKIRKETGTRITLVAPDGRVLYESDRSPAGMENHSRRPEIQQARREGWGVSVRRSATLEEDLLYVAHRGPKYTVRMAYSLAAIREQLLALWFKALLLFAGVLGALFWLNARFSRSIDRDTRLMRESLEKILEKRYDEKLAPVKCCLEFAQLRQLLERVAKKLAKRERQKAKYTRKLKNLTRRQSEIIGAISHEFKNPVAAIMGYAQSLEEDEGLDPQLRRRFLGKIHSNAEKISLMIDRLALAIRLENRSFTPRKSRFELGPVAENVRETLLQKYPRRKIVLECERVWIEADRDMIEQVLFNLVENALKYSGSEVRIRCTRERIEVLDRGEGIGAKDLEKITRKFYRVDRHSWNNSIGVGLYIVKYILRLHETELEIESREGEGSSFSFSLEKMETTDER